MLHVSSCVLVLCVVVSRSQYITASTSNATATATNTGVGVRAELDEIVVEMREANVNDLYLHYYFIRSCDPSIRKPIGRFKKQLKNGKVSLTILDRCLVYQVCGCWNSEVGEVVGTSRKQCSERERQCNDSVHVDISDIYKPDRPTFVSQSVTEKSVSVVCQPEVNSQVEWLMDRNSYRFEAEIGCAEAETEAEAEAGVGNETRMRAEGERCNIETEEDEDEDEDEADAGKSKSGIRKDGNQLQQQQQQRRQRGQREQVSDRCDFKFDRLKANRTYVLRIRAVQGNGSVKSDALEVGIKTDGETRRKPDPAVDDPEVGKVVGVSVIGVIAIYLVVIALIAFVKRSHSIKQKLDAGNLTKNATTAPLVEDGFFANATLMTVQQTHNQVSESASSSESS